MLCRAAGDDTVPRALECAADASPAVLEDKAATQQFLLQLTVRLVVDREAPRDSGPHVRSAVARLLSMYALWFAATAGAPMEQALRYLFLAMVLPEVRAQRPCMLKSPIPLASNLKP